jgi:hypothetical protein
MAMTVKLHSPTVEGPPDASFEIDLLRSKTSRLTGGMWSGIVLALVSLVVAVIALMGVQRRSAEIGGLQARLASADSLQQATLQAATATQDRILGVIQEQQAAAERLANLQARSRALASQLAQVGEQAGRADSAATAAADDPRVAMLTNQLQQMATQTARLDSLQRVALAAQENLRNSGSLQQAQLDRQAAAIDGVGSDLGKFRNRQVAWDAVSLVTHVVALVKR